jgi:hypothetical protein
MKIVACGNINNNTVLEYKSANNDSGFKNFRSFSIQSDKADEFVQKYNKQSKILSKFCTFSTVLGFLAGMWSGKKFVTSVIKAGCGALFGFVCSSFVAYKYNDKLMEKYNVKSYKL